MSLLLKNPQWRMRRSPAYIETPQIRLPPVVNLSHKNIRRVHSEHTQNFIYPSLKCKQPIHTKLLAPNDLISLSYRTQDCCRNDNVYYELKIKIRLKYFSATRPVLEDFLGFLKVSLSRHNKQASVCVGIRPHTSLCRTTCRPSVTLERFRDWLKCQRWSALALKFQHIWTLTATVGVYARMEYKPGIILLSPIAPSAYARIRRLSPSKFKHVELSRPAQTCAGIPANHESAPRSPRADALFCIATYADVYRRIRSRV